MSWDVRGGGGSRQLFFHLLGTKTQNSYISMNRDNYLLVTRRFSHGKIWRAYRFSVFHVI